MAEGGSAELKKINKIYGAVPEILGSPQPRDSKLIVIDFIIDT